MDKFLFNDLVKHYGEAIDLACNDPTFSVNKRCGKLRDLRKGLIDSHAKLTRLGVINQTVDVVFDDILNDRYENETTLGNILMALTHKAELGLFKLMVA